ncbi:glutathione S-transferase kappa 1-like [Stegodyphus dumicola]|uniref:glutathione S-transferase kappa 1-like n=1 Tax=Stegodyphus dumicola TaxID=202533 RepID=UPI0015AB2BB7|nr:glutathione S-transferase kappa 1-like [Stegodyphus dumicola]
MAKCPVLIEFFYDIISPYSFLAFEVLHRYKPIWNINLKLKPVLLGGIMKSSGNSPPAVVPNKGAYMARDLKRLQKYFEVPLSLPHNLMDLIMKQGSLNAQRFITAVDILKPEYLEGISRALWLRLYDQHKDITEEESFKEAAHLIEMDPEILEKSLHAMHDNKTKQRLRKYTDDALEYSAFGAPMIVAHVSGTPEVFFGSDRFELLAYTLGETWMGPVPNKLTCKL